MNPSFYQTFAHVAALFTAFGWPMDTFRFTALGENISIIGCDRGRLYVRLPDDTEAPLARFDTTTNTAYLSAPTLARLFQQPLGDARNALLALGAPLATTDLREQDGAVDAWVDGAWHPLITRDQEVVPSTLLHLHARQAA